MDKNTEIDFFNEIIVGAKIGIDSIQILLPKVADEKLKGELARQLAEYEHIKTQATKELTSLGGAEKNIPMMLDFWSKVSSEISTLFNKSTSHIAEKLMNGNLMGIVGISRVLNKSKNISASAKKFASMFIGACEINLKNLKAYL